MSSHDRNGIRNVGKSAALLFAALCILLGGLGGPAFAGDVCGNGVIEGDETCDPPGAPAGQPDECRADCTFCGDGIVDMFDIKGQPGGEECDDGNNVDGDGCSATCTIDLPPECGNGIVEAGETCDPPGQPAGQPDECRGDCTFCGDGIVDMFDIKGQPGGEECDDGNNVDGDGCSATCTIDLPPECGNGIVEAGETCDPPGQPAGQPDECRGDCTFCGDGIVDMFDIKGQPGGEECDDGNNVDGDGCSATCTIDLPPECGNGIVEGDETCDPPGQPAGQPDECRDDCTFCGDGIVDMFGMKGQAGGEECDDGNNVDGDGCSATCTIELCGNGIIEGDETCDPPGQPAGQPDECRGDCTFCGDGILDPTGGEECDDGNNDDGDGCRADCTIEICGDGMLDPDETCDPPGEPAGEPNECRDDCTFCGDGIVDMFYIKGQPVGGEECDDGNNDDGDGCSSDCRFMLLAVLESFTATVTADGVRIAWVTALEIDNVGFRLLRARVDDGGSRGDADRERTALEVPLHEGLLPAAGSELEGAAYEFLDNTRLVPGTYHYILEDMDLFGRVTRHEPVVVVIHPAVRVAPAGRTAPAGRGAAR